MKKISKILGLLLLACSFVTMFSACGEDNAFEEDEKDIVCDGGPHLLGRVWLSATETKEIKDAYLKIDPNRNENDITLRCYGSFDGVYVLFVDDSNALYSDLICKENVSGVEFIYSDSQQLTVYAEGEFYSLSESFEKGLLTHEELLEVQNNYLTDHQFLYSTESGK